MIILTLPRIKSAGANVWHGLMITIAPGRAHVMLIVMCSLLLISPFLLLLVSITFMTYCVCLYIIIYAINYKFS